MIFSFLLLTMISCPPIDDNDGDVDDDDDNNIHDHDDFYMDHVAWVLDNL